MRDGRFWTGVGISLVWIGFAVWMFCTKKHPAELNGWGDFVAGFSAPLAFFWLVLGYLQQGEDLKNNTEVLRLQAQELKHSTEALQLQAAELKNSVEQQSLLVAATRDQLALETAALAEDRTRRRAAALPKFVVKRGASSTSGNVRRHGLFISNVDRTATEVNISFSPGASAAGRHYAAFDDRTELTETLTYSTDAEFDLSISYLDSDEVSGTVIFPITFARLEVGRGKRVVEELP